MKQLEESGMDTSELVERQAQQVRLYFMTDMSTTEQLPQTKPEEELLRNRLQERVETMNRIVNYPDLHIFDLAMTTEAQPSAGRQFLLMVLKAVFQSSMIMPRVQLPLAVKMNDTNGLHEVTADICFLWAVLYSSLGHTDMMIRIYAIPDNTYESNQVH